jgi:hypothetical protein
MAGMPPEILDDPRATRSAGVLVVRIEPFSHRDRILEQVRATAAQAERDGFRAVLADTTQMGPIDLVDRILVASELPKFWPVDVRLAVLCAPEQMMPSRPFENVASGRGTPVRVTTDRAEALAWLAGA